MAKGEFGDLEYSVVELFMRKMQEHFQQAKKKV